ncbi:hypothetical protein PIB30_076012 [Stylosanthes scabra]|uniref:Uncharacterized protein n=1 Tax=Stylosanthes scabra TaxID=79078 RepID=A0ABU6RQW4_9FABA|nr:hypothetical protein [Stylosanthes scabra]
MAKILEALQAMSTSGIPAVLGGERTNVPQYPPNFGSQGIITPLSINQGLTTSIPIYGLPPGYTPPIATYSDKVATTQNIIQPNMDVSQSFPNASIEGVATTRIKPQKFNIPISSVQTYPTMASSSFSKEKLETLEERLRAIEGVNNYGLVEAQEPCFIEVLSLEETTLQLEEKVFFTHQPHACKPRALYHIHTSTTNNNDDVVLLPVVIDGARAHPPRALFPQFQIDCLSSILSVASLHAQIRPGLSLWPEHG